MEQLQLFETDGLEIEDKPEARKPRFIIEVTREDGGVWYYWKGHADTSEYIAPSKAAKCGKYCPKVYRSMQTAQRQIRSLSMSHSGNNSYRMLSWELDDA